MQENGFIAKLLFPAGAQDIPLGTTIAIMVDDRSMIAAFSGDYVEGGAAPKAVKATGI
jgi:pyruvate dehydrogenase E2 component (dihydrolipoamide acetyltransferase)